MKKLVVVAAALVLALGCATPAFASPAHHGVGSCRGIMASGISGIAQSYHDHMVNLMNNAVSRLSAANVGAAVATAQALQSAPQQAAPAAAPAQAPAATQQQAPAVTQQQAPAAQNYSVYGPCRAYTDANGDGICDNHGSACPAYNWNPGNGAGAYGAVCNYYTDVNGDGYCDNHGSNCPRGYVAPSNSGSGTGYGYGGHHSEGRGHHGW